MTILIGTSGYSYDDWVGPFYPSDLSKQHWLDYYAKEFSTCELNFTFYRLPEAKMLERIAAKVPRGMPRMMSPIRAQPPSWADMGRARDNIALIGRPLTTE